LSFPIEANSDAADCVCNGAAEVKERAESERKKMSLFKRARERLWERVHMCDRGRDREKESEGKAG